MANDPFPVVATPTIVGVQDISYSLFDPNPGEEAQAMTYEAQIKWSNGKITIQNGSVVPYLTSAEISALQTLLARLRGKAETAWGNG